MTHRNHRSSRFRTDRDPTKRRAFLRRTRNSEMPNSKSITKRLQSLLTQAAALRASGATWRQVGEALGRAEKTCRNWPNAYPAEWKAALAEAEDQVRCDGYHESMRRLRELVRSPDDASAFRAAHELVHHYDRNSRACRQAATPAPPENSKSEFDDWSIEELVEEADRRDIPVPDCLRQELAREKRQRILTEKPEADESGRSIEGDDSGTGEGQSR